MQDKDEAAILFIIENVTYNICDQVHWIFFGPSANSICRPTKNIPRDSGGFAITVDDRRA